MLEDALGECLPGGIEEEVLAEACGRLRTPAAPITSKRFRQSDG